MNINITFRHMASSDALRSYSAEKVGKLQKFLRQPMIAKVTLSIDGLTQTAEAQISSGGEHLEAKESGDDMYASIDRMMSKLERQIRGAKGAAQARRKGAESVRSDALPVRVAATAAGGKKKTIAKTATRTASVKAPAKKAR